MLPKSYCLGLVNEEVETWDNLAHFSEYENYTSTTSLLEMLIFVGYFFQGYCCVLAD